MKALIINIDNDSSLKKLVELAKKLHLKTKVLDTKGKIKTDEEHEEWIKSAMLNFNAYTQDEPDIEHLLVKEPNPKYKPWKKEA